MDHSGSPCHRHIFCQFWFLVEGALRWRSCPAILLSSDEEVWDRPGVGRYDVGS